jgi:uncharacterized protein YegP (UPF0339 family)
MEIELRKSQWSPTWYWRIVSSNGQIMATSESYWDRQEAISAVVSVQAGALAAPFRELTDRETADSLSVDEPPSRSWGKGFVPGRRARAGVR